MIILAEFCFKCYKKYTDEYAKEEDFIITDTLDLCEGCGEITHVVWEPKNLKKYHPFVRWLKRVFNWYP